MGSPAIVTIHDLVRELAQAGRPSAYTDILKRYAAPSDDLKALLRWDDRRYTRTCVHRDADLELVVMCYGPGQGTSIHDHDSDRAWVHPLQGEVVVEHFKMDGKGHLECTEERSLHPGQPEHVHEGMVILRLSNRGPGRAITLNLYAKPMRRWRVYDERTGRSHVAPAGSGPS